MESRYTTSEKLGIALACVAGALAIFLFLVDKTPAVILAMLVQMALLCVYPIVHFLRPIRLRAVSLALVLLSTAILGWKVWPARSTTSGSDKGAGSTTQTPQSSFNSVEENRGTVDSATAGPPQGAIVKQRNPPKIVTSRQRHNSGGTDVQQTSLGNSSPNISQSAPCSVTQIGGTQNQATTNCTFGEVRPKQLKLTPEQVSVVSTAMRPFSDLGVRLILVNGSQDDERFADSLGSAMGAVGIQWAKSRTVLLIWNGGGTTPQGLSCTHSPDADSAVDTLGQALIRLGEINYPIPCKIRDDGSKWFNLYITEK